MYKCYKDRDVGNVNVCNISHLLPDCMGETRKYYSPVFRGYRSKKICFSGNLE